MDESVIKHFEQSVGVIKLSEAIRIGAKLRPQGFGGIGVQVEEGKSCALLAAYEGLHGWPSSRKEALDAYAITGYPLSLEIERRNDALRQTREQIADWLESQGL